VLPTGRVVFSGTGRVMCGRALRYCKPSRLDADYFRGQPLLLPDDG